MLPRVYSRRTLLLGAAVVAAAPEVTGCTRHKPHVPTPSETLLDETLALEDELISAYDVAIATTSIRTSQRRTLVAIRSEHAVHRAALLTAGAQPSPAATGSPTPTITAPRDTTRTLIATETAAATIRTDASVRAPRDLAPLLASLAASETVHAALLREVR
jgi:hypothetical protein